jgi:virginiamycin B lyase
VLGWLFRRRGGRAWIALVAAGCVLGLVPPAKAFVYWANHNVFAVGRAGLDGSGADPKFATLGLAIPCGVAVDRRYIYWTNTEYPVGIGRTPIDGGQPDEFITGATSPCGIAVYGHYLYWANGGNYGSIGRANLTGPLDVQENFVPSEAASGRQDLDQPCGLAVGPSGVYWTDRGSGAIGHANLDGTGETTVIASAKAACGIALDGSTMYWPIDISYPSGASSIATSTTSGAGVDPTFITGLNDPCGLTVFSHYLYISDSPTIDRTDLTSADPTAATIQIAQGNQDGCGVAADALYAGTIKVLAARSLPGGAIALTIAVSNPGAITVRQAGPPRELLRPLRAGTSRAGRLTLTIHATPTAHQLLTRHAALQTRLELVYTPTGGVPTTATRVVALRRR